MFFIVCLAAFSLFRPSVAQSFDALNQCPARTWCHCEPTKIECIQRGIQAIPSFRDTNWKFKIIQLDLNNITTIQSNAFIHLNISEIYIADNQITSIQADAFNTLTEQITVLDLARNKLAFLSDEIGKLTKLRTLDVSLNPIKLLGFRDNVLRSIGDFLIDFRFGDKLLEQWPTSLHHLQALKTLKFYGGDANMDNIPISAFHSFEYTLKKLWIENTSLISTPIALQYLKNINELHFDNNPLVGDAGILIPAFVGMTKTLQTLSLQNNNLTTFPLVLESMVALQNLSLAGNSLEFVSDQAVGRIVSNLTTLDLVNCDLDRIPGALSRLLRLQNLDLSYNHLTTIEKNDLQQMNHLVNLKVSYNPLQYVSKSTFHDLKNLTTLVMHETFLYDVPEALRNLPNLRQLDLTSTLPSIECNCDLDWLYCYTTVNNTGLNILGECETVSLSISDYVKQKVQDNCTPVCH